MKIHYIPRQGAVCDGDYAVIRNAAASTTGTRAAVTGQKAVCDCDCAAIKNAHAGTTAIFMQVAVCNCDCAEFFIKNAAAKRRNVGGDFHVGERYSPPIVKDAAARARRRGQSPSYRYANKR